MIFSSGSQAANNFRNAADEATNRPGYGGSTNDYGNRTSYSSSPSTCDTSGQSTTEKIKEKASDLADQAKSTVRKISTLKRKRRLSASL